MSLFTRASGVLLHPTSLPSKYGMGDLGKSAYDFVDWLKKSHQSLWQILPLGPTSYGDSPYQCLSAFAGNTNLISFDTLVNEGWLMETDLIEVPNFSVHRIDYGNVITYHAKILALAIADSKPKPRLVRKKPSIDGAMNIKHGCQIGHCLSRSKMSMAVSNGRNGMKPSLCAKRMPSPKPKNALPMKSLSMNFINGSFSPNGMT